MHSKSDNIEIISKQDLNHENQIYGLEIYGLDPAHFLSALELAW